MIDRDQGFTRCFKLLLFEIGWLRGILRETATSRGFIKTHIIETGDILWAKVEQTSYTIPVFLGNHDMNQSRIYHWFLQYRAGHFVNNRQNRKIKQMNMAILFFMSGIYG